MKVEDLMVVTESQWRAMPWEVRQQHIHDLFVAQRLLVRSVAELLEQQRALLRNPVGVGLPVEVAAKAVLVRSRLASTTSDAERARRRRVLLEATAWHRPGRVAS